jgi:hypothetical protein
MNLSKNFTLSELTKSQTASRFNLNNTPNAQVIENLKLLTLCVLEPVRCYYNKPVLITSGYRSPEVNAKVGGSRTSDHCLGMAADLEIPGVPNAQIAGWISQNLKFTQLILEFYTPGVPDSGWVHVSYDANNLKNQILTAYKKDGRTVYESGIIA